MYHEIWKEKYRGITIPFAHSKALIETQMLFVHSN